MKLYSPVLNQAFSNPLSCPVIPARADLLFFFFFKRKLTPLNGWVLTRIERLEIEIYLSWSSYSIMISVQL